MPVPADLVVLEIARRKAKAKFEASPRPCGFCQGALRRAAGQLADHPWLLGRADRTAAEKQLAEAADAAESDGARNRRVLMAALNAGPDVSPVHSPARPVATSESEKGERS